MSETKNSEGELPKIKPFEASPFSVGNSHVLTIPSYNIRAGIVSTAKKYLVTMTEIVEEEKKEVETNDK